MRGMRSSALVSILVLMMTGVSAGGAAAQPADTKPWSLTLGAGAFVGPKFPGSDGSKAMALPYVAATWGDRVRLSVPEGLRLSLVRADGFEAGVLARYDFGRKEKDDRRALSGLGDIHGSAELGGFAAYRVEDWRLSATVVNGVGDGHGGSVATIDLSRSLALGRQVSLSVGPSLRLGDDTYARAYFGIDAAQARRSGRPVYAPGGGLIDAGVSATGVWRVAGPWAVIALASYRRLVGDAADSPLVTRGGSPDQVAGGLFVAYRF